MAHFYRARQTDARFIFEVCDSVSGECQHQEPELQHRRYEWPRADSNMSVDQMVREIELLEADRLGSPPEGTPLAHEGRSLSASPPREVLAPPREDQPL